jgi:predicted nucleotidyltransferase
MVINKVLDEVFSTWSNVAVFRVLNRYAIGLSGREVSRLVGMSPKNCLITLSSLENLRMVNRTRGGRDHLFTLNREHYLVSDVILPLLQAEKEYFDKIASFIKSKLKNKYVSLIVFGSVARKEETIESDLDMCIVLENARLKPAVEEIVFDIGFKAYKRFGVSLSSIYFSKKEFTRRARQNKAPVNNIVKEGKVISGMSIKELING